MDDAEADSACGGPVRVGVDVGGTFTDVVLVVDGETTTAKVPTTETESVGVVAGIEAACEEAGVDPSDVDAFRHATTVAVNALLENAVADTALVTTEGFADVLEIGRQARPDLYDLDARRPDPLIPAERRYGVPERATTDGIERPVDEDAVAAVADEMADGAGEIAADAVALSFLHAYAHPENEERAAAILREHLDVPVVASHEVLPAFREYERTATTAADAALAPVVENYLDGLVERTSDLELPTPRLMQANGGIAAVDVVREAPISTVMSGPAAGVVGAGVASGKSRKTEGLITLDMGGTSTDVVLVRDGAVEHTTGADVGGHPVRIPMVDVTTVGAGGGSIARVDEGGALRVGPESAGAEPGPACYDRGGTEPTVTDAALQLGHLGADTTLGADLSLDEGAAEDALDELAAAVDLDGPTAAARGVLEVAAATTTRAIRRVTVERGHDPRDLSLAAFGGAGPMVATRLADRLDVGHVVVPPTSGVLSALGLLAADERQDALRTVRRPLADADPETVEPVYADLVDRTRGRLTAPEAATVEHRADLRYAGQSHELTVEAPDPWDRETVRERFHAAHERERGYRLGAGEADVELVALGVRASVPGDPPALAHRPSGDPVRGHREAHFDGWRETTVYDRKALASGRAIDGPAIVEGGESTLVCPPGWTLSVDDRGAVHLERGPGDEGTGRPSPSSSATPSDGGDSR